MMSSESNDQKFFITGAKVGSKKKKQKESPTARAAKALAIMNGEMPPMALMKKPDSSDDSSEEKDEVMAIGYTGKKQIQDEAIEEADRLEKEMNDMYRELEDMQKMIEGNKDLKCMENLMGTTQEVINTHISSYQSLQTRILDINSDAESAIKELSFYEKDSESGGLGAKLQQLDVV